MSLNKINFPRLEQLPTLSSAHLNGSNGSNREKNRRCQIRANNDFEAIQCWLDEYRHKTTTFRAYQKEAERFLLWCIAVREKPLSSIVREDFELYFIFLDDPQPEEYWCARPTGRHCQRGHATWRPFVGPLSASAKATAISILDSLFNFLVTACYLEFNPLSLMRRRQQRKTQLLEQTFNLEERMLTIDEWHTMLDVLQQWPESNEQEKREKMRLTCIIHLLYFLGLRINELVTHQWNAFRKMDNEWWFYVLGKGDKVGRIPVNDNLLRTIITYRQFLKKPPLPDRNETLPIITSFTTGKSISPRQINKILKCLGEATAERFKHDPEKMRRLKKFSPHWLRHLSASMQDRAGIAFKHIRANHRHENDETTRRYVHAIDSERHAEMQKLTLRVE